MAIEGVMKVGQNSYQGSVQHAETGKTAVEGASGAGASESNIINLMPNGEAKSGTNEESLRKKKTAQDAERGGQAQSESIKKAVEEINRRASSSEAIFGIHEKTNRVTIKIVDKETKKVIKEFPPEKTLDMIAKVWEMAGLLVDEKR